MMSFFLRGMSVGLTQTEQAFSPGEQDYFLRKDQCGERESWGNLRMQLNKGECVALQG